MSTHNFIYLFIFLIELPLESFVTTLKQKDPHWWPPTSGTLLSDHNHLWPRRGFWSQLNNFQSLRAYEHLAKNAKLLMRKLLFNRCLQDQILRWSHTIHTRTQTSWESVAGIHTVMAGNDTCMRQNSICEMCGRWIVFCNYKHFQIFNVPCVLSCCRNTKPVFEH